jgi:hypothetical protein
MRIAHVITENDLKGELSMDSTRVVDWSTRMSLSSIRSGVLIGIALAAGLAACAPDAGDAPALGTTAEDIIGGFPATSAKLNAVGALGIASANGSFTPFCSGTLINPTMVLTAKHCVSSVDPAQLVFLIGPNAFAPVRVVPARGVAVEPTLTGGLIDFGSDVGILHLAQPVNDVTPFPIAALTSARIGSRMVSLGYGVQNNNLTFGTRQSGSMTMKATGGSVFAAIFGTFQNFLQNGAARLFPDLDPNNPAQLAILHQQFDETLLLDGIEAWFGGGAGDAQACTGDGGGPVTARVGTQTVVFGVSSWGFGSNATCTLDGSAYASMNPVSLDFVDYETHCPLVPRAGTCDGLTVALRCAGADEGGHRELRTDCGELGQICGIDQNGALGCIDDPCDGLPPEGVCNGEVATRCSLPGEGERRVVTTDCAAQGQACTLDGGTATCVTPTPACSHNECFTGGPLSTATCDACVGNICGADPFCCQVAWDSICVAEVASVCHQTCPAAPIGGVDPRRDQH